MNVPYSILLVLIAAVVTFFLRAVPFLLFGGKRKMPDSVRVIADRLPPAIMAVLVVYCLKSDLIVLGKGTLGTVIAVVVVIMMHLWKRNTLLSVFSGTAVYMLCLHVLPGLIG